MPSFQELFLLMLVIAFFSMTGLWPVIIRGLRELRGEHVEDAPPGGARGGGSRDVDLCYRMLGLSPSATWEEIERAYRQKAKVHHPDRGGDQDTMRALNEAYARLKSLRRR